MVVVTHGVPLHGDAPGGRWRPEGRQIDDKFLAELLIFFLFFEECVLPLSSLGWVETEKELHVMKKKKWISIVSFCFGGCVGWRVGHVG